MTQNLRAPMSAMLALAGLAGVTLGITAGFLRITIVDSGQCRVCGDEYGAISDKTLFCKCRLALVAIRFGYPVSLVIYSSQPGDPDS
jgi:hypothetical protein